MSTSTTFLHLSDLHLAPCGELVNGIDSRQQVRGVLARIRQLDVSPAFVVVSGDLSDDGSAASYEVVKELLEELGGEEMPVLLALGNHDDRATFRRTVLGEDDADGHEPYCYSQEIDGLRVVVLDSLIPGEDGGALGETQLAWLEAELQRPAARGTLIVLHHCCRLAGPIHHYPAFILRDAAALEAVVARHRGQVLGVLAGHSHQANAAPFGGTLHVTAPAVLCQLDFFSGETFTPISGGGFNLCQIRDGQLVVHPVLLKTEDGRRKTGTGRRESGIESEDEHRIAVRHFRPPPSVLRPVTLLHISASRSRRLHNSALPYVADGGDTPPMVTKGARECTTVMDAATANACC